VELGAWTSEREREAMIIERDADDVARCFALERRLFETGHEQVFAGEITGLISAGAFIAFGPPGARGGEAAEEQITAEYEGMLPVRVMRTPAKVGARASGRGSRGSARGGRGAPDRDERRDWWELNEQGTILRGERSGMALRLGDPVEVRVARVDTIRGRVDLLPVI
jgi:ribonuclease R